MTGTIDGLAVSANHTGVPAGEIVDVPMIVPKLDEDQLL